MLFFLENLQILFEFFWIFLKRIFADLFELFEFFKKFISTWAIIFFQGDNTAEYLSAPKYSSAFLFKKNQETQKGPLCGDQCHLRWQSRSERPRDACRRQIAASGNDHEPPIGFTDWTQK